MTDQEERYDRIAEGYAEWWAPVHRPATLRLLDEIAGDVAGGARRLLDVGCGTGALAAAAVRRWSGVEIDGIDASAGMLAIAEQARAAADPSERGRLRFRRAPADALPFPDGSFDVALTSFVLQLVPSRHRALREMRRVLVRDGRVSLVTWLRGGEPFAADAAYDDALIDAGFDPRDPGGGHDDIASAAAAAAILRRAGFADVSARAESFVHAFTPESYLAFIERFDDEDLFTTMEPDSRSALEADLLARLRRLPAAGLRMDLPIVYATGRRT
jgi:SAM-dependent methyltransferase